MNNVFLISVFDFLISVNKLLSTDINNSTIQILDIKNSVPDVNSSNYCWYQEFPMLI